MEDKIIVKFIYVGKLISMHKDLGNASVTGSHKIPDKNLITPDRRDIPVPPMLEEELENPAYRLRLSMK